VGGKSASQTHDMGQLACWFDSQPNVVKKNKWWENWIFWRKKLSGKFLQDGYRISYDIMLWDMTTMVEMRKK